MRDRTRGAGKGPERGEARVVIDPGRWRAPAGGEQRAGAVGGGHGAGDRLRCRVRHGPDPSPGPRAAAARDLAPAGPRRLSRGPGPRAE